LQLRSERQRTARRQLDHRRGQHQRQLCSRRAVQHVLVRVCALCRTRAHRARARRTRARRTRARRGRRAHRAHRARGARARRARTRRACHCLGAVTSLPTGGRWLGHALLQGARLPLERLQHAERVEVQVVELELRRLRARGAAAPLRCTGPNLRSQIAHPAPLLLWDRGVGRSLARGPNPGRHIDRELRARLRAHEHRLVQGQGSERPLAYHRRGGACE
jgi:hypothetical protein